MNSISKKYIPPIVSLAMFMEAIDTTAINTSLPKMAESLHVGPIDLKIALISYLLSLAIFIPISGWLADKFGAKRIFLFSLIIFTVSSFACGFSNTLAELVIGRFIQGIGGSLMVPVARLIIISSFPKAELVKTMNKVVVPALIGPALGPLLGGFITQTFSWRWIFWINVPFGIINFLLAKKFLAERRQHNLPSLDMIGFLLFGTGLAGLTFGLSALSEEAVKFSSALSIMGVSTVLLFLYFLHSLKQPHPVLNNQLFRWRTFRFSITGNFLSRLGFGGSAFLLPLMFQLFLKYSPVFSGAMIALIALGAMSTKTLSRTILRMFGFKTILIVNTILIGLTLASFSLITPETPFYIVPLLTFIFGVFSSMQYSSINPLAFAEVLPEEHSSASSLHAMVIQLSQTFGVAICALILKGAHPDVSFETLSLHAFHKTFAIMGLFTAFCSLLFVFLKKEDGRSLY